ncbi:uncharacterized protein ACRADG_006146 [Cochliomyia hominivorax]
MASKAILAILAINLLLLQATLAKPTSSGYDHFKSFNVCKLKDTYKDFAPSEKDHNLKPSVQLMKKMIFDLQDLALGYITRAKEFSDKIMKEPVLESNTSPEMKKFKEDLEDFEKQYNACNDIEKLFDLVEIFSNATIDYYEKEADENKVILEVLKKYQVKEMDDEFEKKFREDFITNFGKKIEELKNQLKIEEEGMGEKILKWWNDVKLLKTTDEQIESFKEFMKLYNIDMED